MQIHRFDPDAFVHAYGTRAQRVALTGGDPPFGAMWSVVEPGGVSARDQHHEAEMFFIVEGRGIVEVDGESAEVGRGDAVCAPAFSTHRLRNASFDRELSFLAIWWDDPAAVRPNAPAVAPPRRVLLTATPPTVNGELHLGHISGPYLAADIYRRYLRMQGHQAHYISGSDENQSYVVVKARQKGQTPPETASCFGDKVEQALDALHIRLDVFARPSTSPHHAAFTQEFFSRLHQDGRFEIKTRPSLHCEPCDRYLFEAHVSGRCPHCGHGSDGSACEDCARPNDCVDLLDPTCSGCGSTPTVREFPRFYFPLQRYEKELKAYLETVSMTPHMASLCATMFQEGLPDIAVSHLADWGIRVPVKGFEQQVIYVWMEMCPGYLAATRQLVERHGATNRWEDIWKDNDTEIYQFFGFDNGYFHALLFPALLMAYDTDVRLPNGFVTNEFYLLEGKKFSSSREHAIWASRFATEQPADAIRFYLSLDRPEERRTSFTLPEYEETVRRELSQRWPCWLRALGRKVADEFGGRAPATGTYSASQELFFRAVASCKRQMEASLDIRALSPARAARALIRLVHESATFAAGQQYLARVEERRDERRTAVALELMAARALATMAAPILPDLGTRLWAALGFEESGPSRWEPEPVFVPPGQDVSSLAGFAGPAGERSEPIRSGSV